MTSILTGQLILGTDKRNPLFTVYAEGESDQERLHVYYGLELLEVVLLKLRCAKTDEEFNGYLDRLGEQHLFKSFADGQFGGDSELRKRTGRVLDVFFKDTKQHLP